MHKTSLTQQHFIEGPIPSQESELLCIHVLGYQFGLCLYDCPIEFWNCSDSVVFFICYFIIAIFGNHHP